MTPFNTYTPPPAKPEPQPAPQRWGIGTWALVLACLLFPPLGIVAFLVYWWRGWK